MEPITEDEIAAITIPEFTGGYSTRRGAEGGVQYVFPDFSFWYEENLASTLIFLPRLKHTLLTGDTYLWSGTSVFPEDAEILLNQLIRDGTVPEYREDHPVRVDIFLQNGNDFEVPPQWADAIFRLPDILLSVSLLSFEYAVARRPGMTRGDGPTAPQNPHIVSDWGTLEEIRHELRFEPRTPDFVPVARRKW